MAKSWPAVASRTLTSASGMWLLSAARADPGACRSNSCGYNAANQGTVHLSTGGMFMRGKYLCLVAIAMLATGGTLLSGGNEAGEKELKKLQGTWQFVAMQMGDKAKSA